MIKTEDNLQQRTLLLTYMQERQISHSTKDQIFRLLAKSKDKELSSSKILEIVKSNKDENEILRLAKEINS